MQLQEHYRFANLVALIALLLQSVENALMDLIWH
jgi:hypothetical protein